MQRREFITFFGCTAVVWPLVARAQQIKKVPRVGVLWHAGSAEAEDIYLSVLVKALSDLGHVDGRTVRLEHRFPAEPADRFRSMARELVDSKVDVIVAVNGIGAKEAKQVSSTIPIVVVIEADPVGSGLIESLSHPGGNVTGLSLMAVDLSGKRLGLLKEAVPNLSRVGLMIDMNDLAARRVASAYSTAARILGLDLRPFEVSSPDAIDLAFSKITTESIDGIIVGPGSMIFNERARIGRFALEQKIPMEVVVGEMVPFGPLLSYGPDFPDYFRRAAGYTDKILKGARPAELPVEQPSRFKLVVNVKTAKALGLSVPLSLLTAADEIIE